jgi:hypothetical protein
MYDVRFQAASCVGIFGTELAKVRDSGQHYVDAV